MSRRVRHRGHDQRAGLQYNRRKNRLLGSARLRAQHAAAPALSHSKKDGENEDKEAGDSAHNRTDVDSLLFKSNSLHFHNAGGPATRLPTAGRFRSDARLLLDLNTLTCGSNRILLETIQGRPYSVLKIAGRDINKTIEARSIAGDPRPPPLELEMAWHPPVPARPALI